MLVRVREVNTSAACGHVVASQSGARHIVGAHNSCRPSCKKLKGNGACSAMNTNSLEVLGGHPHHSPCTPKRTHEAETRVPESRLRQTAPHI